MKGSFRSSDYWKYCLLCGKGLEEHSSEDKVLWDRCLQDQLILVIELSETLECPKCSDKHDSVPLELNINHVLECTGCRLQYEIISHCYARSMSCEEVVNIALPYKNTVYAVPLSEKGGRLYRRHVIQNELAYREHRMNSTHE